MKYKTKAARVRWISPAMTGRIEKASDAPQMGQIGVPGASSAPQIGHLITAAPPKCYFVQPILALHLPQARRNIADCSARQP